MENSIILLAFGAMLAWGLSDFLIQKSVKRIGNFETMAWLGFLGAIALLPFVAKDFALLSFRNGFFLAVLGISVFIMNYFAFEAFKSGKLSVVEVVHTVELPLTIMFGIVLLRERISPFQWAVILVMFAGIYLISRREESLWDRLKKFFTGRENLWEKGVFLGATGGIICSLVNFMIAYGSKSITPLLAIWFPWLIFAILSLIYISYKKMWSGFFRNSWNARNIILYAGLIDVAAWMFYALALEEKELAITTAITDSYPAIAMFLGIRFNNEKISKFQYFGAVIALSASIVLGLTS